MRPSPKLEPRQPLSRSGDTREMQETIRYMSGLEIKSQVKLACRKAERDYEKKLAKEVKCNPKAFFKYAKTKLKTRTGTQDLVREDGTTHTAENQKANGAVT